MKRRMLLPLLLTVALLSMSLLQVWAQDQSGTDGAQTNQLFLPLAVAPNPSQMDKQEEETEFSTTDDAFTETDTATFAFAEEATLLLPEGSWSEDQLLWAAANEPVLRVTKRADTNDGFCNHDCSLREAVAEATISPLIHEIILVPSGLYKLRLGGLELSNLDLIGAGAANTILDGNKQFRVLQIPFTAAEQIQLESLTIQNGRDDFYAGIVHSGGELTIQNCLIRNNAGTAIGTFGSDAGPLVINDSRIEANAKRGLVISENRVTINRSSFKGNLGGGIRVSDSGLEMFDTTISNNRTPQAGGGIELVGGTLRIERSTISGNQAERGGGIYRSESNLRLLNSTLSDNRVTGDGGGLYIDTSSTQVLLESVTLVGNRADSDNDGVGQGGGLFFAVAASAPPDLALHNTILALNRKGSRNSTASDCAGGAVESQGYNLIQTIADCTLAGDTTGNILGQNPRLGTLANKGGFTLVHMPATNSPLINAASPSDFPATDQRGVTRPQQGRSDIGAVERLPNGTNLPTRTPTPTATPFPTLPPTPSGSPTPTFTPAPVEQIEMTEGGDFSSLSAEGRLLAISSQNNQVFLHDRQNKQTKLLGDVAYSPAMAAAGQFVAFTRDSSATLPGGQYPFANVFVYNIVSNSYERISIGVNGSEPTSGAGHSDISADGRSVVFGSNADNFVFGDRNGADDIFVYDRQRHNTQRVSVGPNGEEANDGTPFSAISGNGRYVAFASYATNLAANDTNGNYDVFVYDLQSGQVELISKALDGTPAGEFGELDLSSDGRYVVFASEATNLVAGDNNQASDIFVRDRQEGLTERLSVANNGTEADNHSFHPQISADGRYVAFYSSASNLVAGDTNAADDVFVHDRQNHTTRRLSVPRVGTQSNGQSYLPAISANGCVVSFRSSANNLVPGDTNRRDDIFAYSGVCQ